MSDLRHEKVFKFNWILGLVMNLLFGIPWFLIVLNAKCNTHIDR